MKKALMILIATLLLTIMIAPLPVQAAKQVRWSVPGDFVTIQEAIDSGDVKDGDIIAVGPGTFAGALVDKSVTIMGIGGAIINDGPAHSSGLIQGFRLLADSDGAAISNFTFDGVDLAIMNGAAVSDVVVDHCTFLNTIQAISNWVGSGWTISHNDIIDLRTRNGGGIGILIADYTGDIVENNVVSHNRIYGTLHVDSNDGGGYNGSGIVLYADFRWSRDGADEITNNRVIHNKISLTSDTPAVVDVVAFEMTDTRDDINADPYPVIFDNAVGFNDFRGTDLQIDLTPDNLGDYNDISRNLGDNRGHGVHPSVFK